MENYSLSDIAAATGDSSFGNGNSAWILILLFAMIFGGNGFGFNNRSGDFGQFATSASQSEILLGQQFQNLSQAINQVGDGLCSSTFALNNSIKDGNAAVASSVINEGRSLQSQVADCCCTTQRNIDSVRFDMANYSSAIQKNDCDNTQKILDAISQNKMESLQARINQLELQSALCGVVRYPNNMAYNAGPSPFCNCGCRAI